MRLLDENSMLNPSYQYGIPRNPLFYQDFLDERGSATSDSDQAKIVYLLDKQNDNEPSDPEFEEWESFFEEPTGTHVKDLEDIYVDVALGFEYLRSDFGTKKTNEIIISYKEELLSWIAQNTEWNE